MGILCILCNTVRLYSVSHDYTLKRSTLNDTENKEMPVYPIAPDSSGVYCCTRHFALRVSNWKFLSKYLKENSCGLHWVLTYINIQTFLYHQVTAIYASFQLNLAAWIVSLGSIPLIKCQLGDPAYYCSSHSS